jgi:hypothetical protein
VHLTLCGVQLLPHFTAKVWDVARYYFGEECGMWKDGGIQLLVYYNAMQLDVSSVISIGKGLNGKNICKKACS